MGLIKSFGRALGRAIEKAGDFVGIEGISRFGRGIQDLCSERIATEKAYDKQRADIHTTERLMDTLSAFSDAYLDKADDIENRCICAVEQYYDRLIELLEEMEKGNGSKAGLRRLRNARGKIKQSIRGSVRNLLAQRMSIDDAACCRILKMDAGTEKRQEMAKFCQKVIQEALRNVSSQVRNSLEVQLEDIQDYLKDIQEEQEREFSTLKQQFDMIVQKGSMEKGEREKYCVKPASAFKAAEFVEELLG